MNGQIEVVDMFSMLGIEPEEIKEEKKSRVKTSSNKKKATAGKTKNKDIKLPVTIYTGYRKPLVLTKDDFEGKELVDKNQLLKAMEKVFPEYTSSCTELEKDSKQDNIFYAGFRENFIISKGNVELNKNSKLTLAGTDFDLSSVMTDLKCEVSIEEIAKYFSDSSNKLFTNISIARVNKDTFSPVFKLPILNEELKFPIQVYIFGRDKFKITLEEYKTYLKELGNDVSGDVKYEKGAIEDLIVQRFPDFADGHLELQYNKDFNIVLPCMKLKGIKSSEAKKVMIPTEGTEISLIFTRIPLDPSLFQGQLEVEEKEIILFLNKKYPEYAEDRTRIVYDAENKLIMPIIQGSSKGCLETIIDDPNELMLRTDIKNGEYSLFHYKTMINDELRIFRVESTPVSLTIAPTDNKPGGRFEYRYPFVSGKLYDCAKAFFNEIADIYNTEVLLCLYYDRSENTYFWELPYQRVTISRVFADYDVKMQLNHNFVHIADFHSHNCYPANFSDIDDHDEKGNRVYGVFGPFCSEEETKFIMRAGTGGYYVPITKNQLFTNEKASKDEINTFCNNYIGIAQTKVLF